MRVSVMVTILRCAVRTLASIGTIRVPVSMFVCTGFCLCGSVVRVVEIR